MPKTTKTGEAKTPARTRKAAASRTAGPDALFTHDDIARRAYELFLQDGRHGRDLDHWLLAERELLERSSAATR
jgi:hypothetical protein